MDSCSSGSVSSSGGDDEYDSRAEYSVSTFFNRNHHHPNNNTNPFAHVGPPPNPPLPSSSPSPVLDHHRSMFDPLSNFFDPLSSSSSPPLAANQTSVPNFDMVWTTNLRSDHTTCTDHDGFMAASSSLPTQLFFTNQTRTTPSVQLLQPQDAAPTRIPTSAAGPNDHQPSSTTAAATTATTNTVRNPKKRSRASRRAPTTVLTTDTTNFRAMVQEFTGIPAPPFTSLPFSRSRFDLFGNSTAAAHPLRSVTSHLELSQPSLLFRPFAHKTQPPLLTSSSSSSSSSSLINSMASSTTTNVNAAPDSGLLKYPTDFPDINVQNSPILNFETLLQRSSKHPLSNSSIPGSSDHDNPQQQLTLLDNPSNDLHRKTGVVEGFGLNQTHVSAEHTATPIQNTVSDHNNNWVDGVVVSNEVDHMLRSINGGNDNTRGSKARKISAKVCCTASSSDLHDGEKGSVTNMNMSHTRIEGMVGSWISSSD